MKFIRARTLNMTCTGQISYQAIGMAKPVFNFMGRTRVVGNSYISNFVLGIF